MKIKSLIAAIDAEKLAKEAKERATLKSKNQKDHDELPEFLKKALGQPSTQEQMRPVRLKERWHPPGYIPVWELLNLTGAYKFKEWSGEELDIIANPPKCLEVSDALDPDDIQELIWYAFSNGFIKEGIKQPPSLSDDDLGVWQDDWLYLHRIGKFIGAKTKEDAIDGWLKEVRFIIAQNCRYNSAFKKVDEVRTFLRDMLYTGSIRAVRSKSNDLENIPRTYWLADESVGAFSDLTPLSDILFEHASVDKFLKKHNFSDGTKSTVSKRGRRAGDGAYNDAAFLREMKVLIESGEAKSAQDASIMLTKKYEKLKDGPKGQSQEAITDRLARKYRGQEKTMYRD